MMENDVLNTINFLNMQNRNGQIPNPFMRGDIVISKLDFINDNKNFLIVTGIENSSILICEDKDKNQIKYEMNEVVAPMQLLWFSQLRNTSQNQASADFKPAEYENEEYIPNNFS